MIGALVEMNRIQDHNPIEVGARIRNARNALNLTQEVVAERSYITSQFLSRIETGNMRASVDTYYRIAAALNLTLDDIFYENATAMRLHKAFSRDELLNDCTNYEKAVISEMMLAMRDVIMRNRMK
jgi:transcriptional regulator with XRE-family HTH domain